MRIGIGGGGVAGLGLRLLPLAARPSASSSSNRPRCSAASPAASTSMACGSRSTTTSSVATTTDLIDILGRLGMHDELEWRPGRMKFFYRGRLYPFGTPWDLLRFRPLSLTGRIRFGLNVALSRSAQVVGALRVGHGARLADLAHRRGRPTRSSGSPCCASSSARTTIRSRRRGSGIASTASRARARNILARERLGFLKRGTRGAARRR